ncbi:helix-turn-helix transcriptional regulator [Ectobacillus antri]|uniref:Helix-turn-helix transcriptional regulator n=1 Tax=Ectobacillus antri TaxID=2486280 RepID=A0ABT6H2N2_9BACI|nr:helix-turn-helix transcriptional regulator [Ectobacillus antri]MDG4658098.1 helix-turn-helix transcriptional regulator [Ectobacillus antri]MDG5753661.1 helix-turn-helix transcriptional regulator [Ectobacillus antri]
MKEISKLIGERIRYYRKQNGLNQEELAFKSSLHPTSIGRIERGEMTLSIDNLAKITVALNISLEEFFSLIDPQDQYTNDILTEVVLLLSRKSTVEQKKALQILKLVFDMTDSL